MLTDVQIPFLGTPLSPPSTDEGLSEDAATQSILASSGSSTSTSTSTSATFPIVSCENIDHVNSNSGEKNPQNTNNYKLS